MEEAYNGTRLPRIYFYPDDDKVVTTLYPGFDTIVIELEHWYRGDLPLPDVLSRFEIAAVGPSREQTEHAPMLC